MSDTFQLPKDWLQTCRRVVRKPAAIVANAKPNNELPSDWLKQARLLLAQQEIARLKWEDAAKNQRIAELTELSSTDPLTGLLNRRGFEEATPLMFAITARDNFEASAEFFTKADKNKLSSKEVEALVFIFIDIDNLKTINDKHGGHKSGDEYICQTAAALRKALARDEDIIARIGGDEFAAIIRLKVGNLIKDVETVVERIRKLIENNAKDVEGRIGTASIGAAIIIPTPDDEECIPRVLQIADVAAYQSKTKGGRNCVHVVHIDGTIRASSLNPTNAISETPPTRGTQAPPPAPPAPGG